MTSTSSPNRQFIWQSLIHTAAHHEVSCNMCGKQRSTRTLQIIEFLHKLLREGWRLVHHEEDEWEGIYVGCPECVDDRPDEVVSLEPYTRVRKSRRPKRVSHGT